MMSFPLLPCHWWTTGLHRNTRNVLQLGIGFFFTFLAFHSQGFIEESVLESFRPKHLCIIYASFTVPNFVAPPIIKCLGTRTSLALAGCTYVLFLAGFLFINPYFLYGSSALLGLGAAVIWTAQGKYLTLNSSDQTAGKHSSLFLAFTVAWSVERGSPVCLPVSMEELEMNTGTGEEHQKQKEEGTLDQIKSIFKLAASRKMVTLAFVFGYTGIMLSFWSSIFPTALINTLQLRSQFSPKILIALNAIIKGTGQLLGECRFDRKKCVWSSVGSEVFSECPVRMVSFGQSEAELAALLHLVAVALTFLILPNESSLGQTNETALIRPSVVVALFCGFLLCFGNAFGLYKFSHFSSQIMPIGVPKHLPSSNSTSPSLPASSSLCRAISGSIGTF
uniref:UNC93-like protein MFSD11 n=1 Tax=Globodera rostochiensis TaxID=31243 RepID=A0A914H3A6_GLORO